MSTSPRQDLQALACQDCPADATVSRQQGLAGPVLVVMVVHEPTCPWLARVAPDGVARAVIDGGLLLHTAPE